MCVYCDCVPFLLRPNTTKTGLLPPKKGNGTSGSKTKNKIDYDKNLGPLGSYYKGKKGLNLNPDTVLLSGSKYFSSLILIRLTFDHWVLLIRWYSFTFRPYMNSHNVHGSTPSTTGMKRTKCTKKDYTT